LSRNPVILRKLVLDDGFEIIFLACLGKNWLYYTLSEFENKESSICL